MKKVKQAESRECREIQNRLAETAGGIPDTQAEEHLKTCGVCRDFAARLEQIRMELQPEQQKGLTPRPAIREQLLAKVASPAGQKPPVQSGILYLLKRWLTARVPVYQAAAGFLLILIAAFGIRSIELPKPANQVQSIWLQPQEDLNVLYNLDILRGQKIGRTAAEDSVLNRIFTSM